MLIPVTFAPSSSTNPKLPSSLAKISHDEVVLIELQGALEVDSSYENERNGKLVGKLKMDAAMTKPILLIGHHHLEGKIATLPKPLAVLHRTNATPNVDDKRIEDEGMDCDDDSQATSMKSQSSVSWDAVAIVKRKIIFSKRPMPIVGQTG